MKRLYLIATLILALSVPASGQMVIGSGAGGEGCTENCGDYLVCQNFEGSGYDNSESWTESVGTNGVVDEDDTTATVLRGSQQLKIYAGDSGQISYTQRDFTNQSTLSFHAKIKISMSTGGYLMWFSTNEGETTRFAVEVSSTKYLRLTHGSVETTATTTQLQNDTEYHLWGDYTPESINGANDGAASIYISTTTTKPGSPEVSTAVGDSEFQLGRVRLRVNNQNTAYFDQLLIDTTTIGNVCD
jgi:hypothetical protein